ncbi:glycerol dehydrogenase-like iron-containing ADH family enzyme [Desulfitispora alkaliphila]|uniref:hypothetical protein n=1 Tax=Desulfitispora alkaliphila TaxID=622674 RepID=UPI003D1FAD02
MPVITLPSRLETGAGSIQNISQLVNAEGCSKVLIIVDVNKAVEIAKKVAAPKILGILY